MSPSPKELPALPAHAPAYWAEACKHLVKKDRVMRRLIPQFSAEALQTRGDPFITLARSIMGQQVSVKSAASIWKRFSALPAEMTPAQVLLLLWQVSQAVTPAWMAVAGLPVTPSAAPLWQVAHDALTPKLACSRPLDQVVVLPLWQLSQDALPMPLTPT